MARQDSKCYPLHLPWRGWRPWHNVVLKTEFDQFCGRSMVGVYRKQTGDRGHLACISLTCYLACPVWAWRTTFTFRWTFLLGVVPHLRRVTCQAPGTLDIYDSFLFAISGHNKAKCSGKVETPPFYVTEYTLNISNEKCQSKCSVGVYLRLRGSSHSGAVSYVTLRPWTSTCEVTWR